MTAIIFTLTYFHCSYFCCFWTFFICRGLAKTVGILTIPSYYPIDIIVLKDGPKVLIYF